MVVSLAKKNQVPLKEFGSRKDWATLITGHPVTVISPCLPKNAQKTCQMKDPSPMGNKKSTS